MSEKKDLRWHQISVFLRILTVPIGQCGNWSEEMTSILLACLLQATVPSQKHVRPGRLVLVSSNQTLFRSTLDTSYPRKPRAVSKRPGKAEPYESLKRSLLASSSREEVWSSSSASTCGSDANQKNIQGALEATHSKIRGSRESESNQLTPISLSIQWGNWAWIQDWTSAKEERMKRFLKCPRRENNRLWGCVQGRLGSQPRGLSVNGSESTSGKIILVEVFLPVVVQVQFRISFLTTAKGVEKEKT